MTHSLLVFNVHIKVADHHDAAVSANTLLASAEFARLHVALHDIDAILLIEGDTRDLVEADDVVLTDQAALAICVVDEHPRDSGFSTGNEMRVRRNLLEQVALAGSSGPEFNDVVVTLHER